MRAEDGGKLETGVRGKGGNRSETEGEDRKEFIFYSCFGSA